MADPQRVRSIFLEAVEHHVPDQWSVFLDRECSDEPDLRQRVEVLLRAHEQANSMLDVAAVPPVATIDQPTTETAGTIIGPYKLIEPIGEGGMGTVWRAQQTEPVKRLVALKLIKAGMDSKQVIARFEAERQALALMDHPNIARVLDAGTTGAGRPYFVMDLVKGVPITKYCDEHRLTPRQRLELFVPVCQAVQHAHQKGIIHRDLKPSNVLVALYDGKPVPKVIDFGVAKAAGQSLTEKTLVTGFGAIVGTLEYMSPEQAEINQLDIDTRCDIYSLGVLLYELLSGSTPFSRKGLEKAGMLEMLRLIREEEPTRPSTKLSTAEGLPTLAANRGTEPAKLTRLVRGELDWIVMKALEKDRNRRYDTANAFAADVHRYLHDEPVAAGPPSSWYRFRKFARRNRAALAVTAIVVALLGVVAVGSLIAALLLEQKQQQTQAQKERAETNFRMAFDAVDTLMEVGEQRLRNEPNLDPVRRRLMARALHFYERFLQQRGGDPAVQIESGIAYVRAASLLLRLGELAKAEDYVHKGRAILEALVAAGPADAEHRFQLARAYYTSGLMLLKSNRPREAEPAYRRSIELCRGLSAEEPSVLTSRMQLADAHNGLATVLGKLGRHQEAIEAQRDAVSIARKLVELLPKARECLASLVVNSIGLIVKLDLEMRDGTKVTEQLHKDMLDAAEKLCQLVPGEREYESYLALGRTYWAEWLTDRDRFAEAEVMFNKSLPVHQALVRDFPRQLDYREGLARALLRQGHFYQQVNRLKEAASTFEEARQLFEQLVEMPTMLECRSSLASVYMDLGMILKDLQMTKAEEYCKKGHDLMKAQPADRPRVQARLGAGLNNLAIFLNERRELTESRKLLEQAIVHQQTALKAHPKHQHWRMYLRHHYSNLAWVLANLNELDLAEDVFRRELELLEALHADFPEKGLYAQLLAERFGMKAVRMRNAKRSAEAEEAYRRSIEGYEKLVLRLPSVPRYRSEFGAMVNDLATLFKSQRRMAEARPLLEKAIPEQHKALEQDPANPRYRLFLRHHYFNLADVILSQGDHVQAAAKAEELASALPDWWNSQYTAAQILRGCAARISADAGLSEAKRVELRSSYVLRSKKLRRAAAQLQPDDPGACNNLAWFLATDADPRFHDGKLAVALAESIVKAQPRKAEYWNTLGAARYRAGQPKEAVAALNESMRLHQGVIPSNWLFLAMAHGKLEDKETARKWYDQAVQWIEKNAPRNEELRRFRTEAEGLLGIAKKEP
jgi:serine/threonine protein kinase/tetratricopeptide (TPR) repeat protein